MGIGARRRARTLDGGDVSLLWGRNADDGVIHAEDVEYDEDRGDTHPSGFVCPSLPCARSLTWYEQFPRFGKMVPRHFQLTRLAPGKTATHSEDGTWLAPDARGVPPPSPVRRTTLDVAPPSRVTQAARRASACRGAYRSPGIDDSRASVLGCGRFQEHSNVDLGVGGRHAARRDSPRRAGRRRGRRFRRPCDVAWRNFVYEPHRYVDLAERVARFGHITHLLALVVRPREVSEQDGMFRLA